MPPSGVLDGGKLGPDRCDERPMFVPNGAAVDPAREDLQFRRFQRRSGFRRRHPLFRIGRDHPQIGVRFLGLAGHERSAVVTRSKSVLATVESKAGFARPVVRSVAGVAMVREDRADVKIIRYFLRAPRPSEGAESHEEDGQAGNHDLSVGPVRLREDRGRLKFKHVHDGLEGPI